ncbi:MAG TPA: sialidase family protein [Candidatus Dormibacteraeota bacterium]
MAALVMVVPALASSTPIVGPNVQVTQDRTPSRTNLAPFTLVDRSSSSTVYLSEVEADNGLCRFYVSQDGGSTWALGASPQTSSSGNCGPGAFHPEYIRTQLAQGSDGTLYYAFSANNPNGGGSRSALVGRSTDQGKTWHTTYIAHAPDGTSSTNYELDFITHIAIDPSNPKLVYADFRRDFPKGSSQPANRPYLVVSTDGGATFGTPRMITDNDVEDDAPWLVAANGKIYASFLTNVNNFSSADFYVSYSSNQGQSWTQTKFGSATSGDAVGLAYDSSRNQFYVVWDAEVGTSNNWHINFATSSDTRSWSKPKQLNSDPATDGRGHLFPHMSLSPSGRIDVAWYDFRNDPTPPPDASNGGFGNWSDTYMVSSSDGGATWGPNIRLTDGLSNRNIGTFSFNLYYLVDQPGVASSDNTAVIAWTDTRNGDTDSQAQDIYSAVVSFSGSAAAGTYTTGDLVIVIVVVALAALAAGIGITLLVSGRLARGRLRPSA